VRWFIDHSLDGLPDCHGVLPMRPEVRPLLLTVVHSTGMRPCAVQCRDYRAVRTAAGGRGCIDLMFTARASCAASG